MAIREEWRSGSQFVDRFGLVAKRVERYISVSGGNSPYRQHPAPKQTSPFLTSGGKLTFTASCTKGRLHGESLLEGELLACLIDQTCKHCFSRLIDQVFKARYFITF